jgi:hypothetical protein
MRTDPEGTKNTDDLTVLFALLGSAHAKAARRTLMKLTPGVNFTNIIRTAFAHVDPKSVKRY